MKDDQHVLSHWSVSHCKLILSFLFKAELRVAACENEGVCKKLDWSESVNVLPGIVDTPAAVVVCPVLNNQKSVTTPDLWATF